MKLLLTTFCLTSLGAITLASPSLAQVNPSLAPTYTPGYRYTPTIPPYKRTVYTTVTGTIFPGRSCNTITVFGVDNQSNRLFPGTVTQNGANCAYTLTVTPQVAQRYKTFIIGVYDSAIPSSGQCFVQPVDPHQPGANPNQPIPTVIPMIYPGYHNLNYRGSCFQIQ